MERRLAIAPSQTNPSGIGMATEYSTVPKSWLDRHFPSHGLDQQIPAPAANPWFHPRELLPYQNLPLPKYPWSSNIHGFYPQTYPIRNHASRFAAPPGFHPYFSSNPTVPLQICAAAEPRSAYPPHDFIGTEQEPAEPSRFHICRICEKTFYSRRSLSGHRASHSRLFNKEKETAPSPSPTLNLARDGPGNSSIVAAHAKGKGVMEEDSVIIIEDSSSEEVEVVEQERHANSKPDDDTATSKMEVDLSLTL